MVGAYQWEAWVLFPNHNPPCLQFANSVNQVKGQSHQAQLTKR